jgi:hypothetical protein
MTPGDWIALGGLLVGMLTFLAAAGRIVYRIGCVATQLDVIADKVQQILDGKAATCAVHSDRLELHDRQIDAIFRKLDSEPHRGDNMRPVADGGG